MQRFIIDTLLVALFLGIIVLPISTLGWSNVADKSSPNTQVLSNQSTRTEVEDILETTQSSPTIQP